MRRIGRGARPPLLCCLLGWVSLAQAADWPTWRFDAARSGCTPEDLPTSLTVQWTRELPPPAPCWPETEWRLQFDRSYAPVVAGQQVFVPSMTEDCVTAYDLATGAQRWRFHADGPIRFAPTVWEGKVYAVSDDGFLYCLDVDSGAVQWKFRGGPSPRKLLGNGRFISAWPARGAPVVLDGTVYFAASIWPFLGTFLHALDAETGAVRWTNSGSGQDFLLQPHHSPAFAGVAPQGYLAATEKLLLIPGGRSVPAAYDRATGAFQYWRADTKRGGFDSFIVGEFFVNDGMVYRLSDGSLIGPSSAALFDGKALLGLNTGGQPAAFAGRPEQVTVTDRKGKKVRQLRFPSLWTVPLETKLDRLFLKAGSRVYGGAADRVVSFAVPTSDQAPTAPWEYTVEGTPWTMLAANGHLLVTTTTGRLYCFGAAPQEVRSWSRPAPVVAEAGAEADRAARLLEATGVTDGYCLLPGTTNGRLAVELARQSNLEVIGLCAEAETLAATRGRFDEQGGKPERLSLVAGSVEATPLPPYVASLLTYESADALWGTADPTQSVRRLYSALRPYGGTACFDAADSHVPLIQKLVAAGALPGAELRSAGDWWLLIRQGPLPGAAPWTHLYGDAANTVCSRDSAVQAPLGLLWFGGPRNQDVLPRHGHGPGEQVLGGRLFIEGVGVFSARDVYTGRTLWRRELPELDTLGKYYNDTYVPDPFDRSYNQKHMTGGNEFGGNFVVAEDRLYLAVGDHCLVLSPATGETVGEFRLPAQGELGVPNWGALAVFEDLLLVTAAPLQLEAKGKQVHVLANHGFAAGSKYLFALDRHTGEVRWRREAIHNFRHNAVAVGNGRVFCIDGLSKRRRDLLKRRGALADQPGALLCLDAKTGQLLWRDETEVFGTWLSYSVDHDLVLEAGSHASDRATDEVTHGMAARRGADGEILWRHDDTYDGPPILWHDWILTQTGAGNTSARLAKAYSLLTGQQVTTTHPLTDEPVPWGWVRFKGCNTAVASQHLLTFRSAAGCYANLPAGFGTTSIGGFKSGCTSNLIPADGVLNAPDYTRTCTCAYQNQADLALFPLGATDAGDLAVESWSFDALPGISKPTPVKRVGLNFGAPGNRTDDHGVLWLEVPSVGGPSPEVPVAATGDGLRFFRRHSSLLPPARDGALNWVAASGLEGVTRVTVRPVLAPANPGATSTVQAYDRNPTTTQLPEALPELASPVGTPRRFTVRLYFAEPADARPGERTFQVALNGVSVLTDFDPAQAGGAAVVKEFIGVAVTKDLVVTLTPAPSAVRPPILSGLELVEEDG